jgi:hypothetical protein
MRIITLSEVLVFSSLKIADRSIRNNFSMEVLEHPLYAFCINLISMGAHSTESRICLASIANELRIFAFFFSDKNDILTALVDS